MNTKQARAILETLAETDGSYKDNSIVWTTTSKVDVDRIQLMCINNGIPCKFTLKNEAQDLLLL